LTVPDDFRFNIDGQSMSVHDLKPGMSGTATITTSTRQVPVTVTEVKNGTVAVASGGAIIVRTNEGIKSFTQGDVDKRNVRIMRDGQPAQISELHQGDRLTAVRFARRWRPAPHQQRRRRRANRERCPRRPVRCRSSPLPGLDWWRWDWG
jgi:hypothetical protein